MQFISREEAQRAVDLAKTIVALAEAGREVILSPADAELVALGLFVIVRVSEHAPHYPEAMVGRV